MAKQLNVDVNLNTAKAEAQLRNLQQQLTQAINGVGQGDGKLTKEIVQATEAAAKLKVALDQSMNVKTGNLDLSKFSQQLKASKMTLSDYGKQLTNLGSNGEKAFMSLARSIVSAETPMRQSGKLMTELWTTMKNTARWQLTSSVLHSFIGGLQSAMSYARGLNESLNSIRIVTGQSAEQMNQFARVANQSAKQLSASTLDYTDAALIYYQQGIRDEKEIKARTDATIKMANVTGTSAQQVSEQMTAIWNNFADGSTNLEYFADVITALGANTASSSAEIAKGLEKFAAVADTVGLSYEYATSALATIVATTRQSEDIVGTALKTLFARIQDLELGKTLEDGTTLGKYSKALDAVGISIKDQNGELRNMDDILDDMGTKWETLSKDQQVALAQTVAGQRQYTQLVALMDNWGFMQENLQVAYGSEGTLQKQADIYAESWEAARTRVRAAWQGIIDELVSDDFFISMNNGLAGLLNGVDSLIGAMGGLPGVLGMIGSIATKVFRTQMTQGIENAINGFKTLTGVSTMEANILRNQAMTAAKRFTPVDSGIKSMSMESQALVKNLQLADLYQKKREQIAQSGKQISASDAARISALQQVVELHQQIAIASQKELENAQHASEVARQNLNTELTMKATKQAKKELGSKASKEEIQARGQKIATDLKSRFTNLQESAVDIYTAESAYKDLGNTGITSAQDAALKTVMQNQMKQSFEQTLEQRQKRIQQERQAQTLRDRIAAAGPGYDGGYIQQLKEKEANIQAQKQREQQSMTEAKRTAQAQKEYDEYKKQLQREQNLQRLRQKEEEAAKEGKELSGPLKTKKNLLESQLMRATKESRDSSGLLKKFKESLPAEQFQNMINEMISDLEIDFSNIEIEPGSIEELLKNAQEEARASVEAERAAEGKNISEQDLEKEIDNLGAQSFDTLAEGITNAFQGVSNLTMGFSSLQQAIVTLNSTDLSFGEKLLQVSMSLSMALPMIASGATAIVSGFKGIAAGASGMVKSIVLANSAMSISEKALVSQQLATDASSISLRRLVVANAESTAASVASGAAAGTEASMFGVLGAAAKAAAASIGSMIMAALPFIAVAGAIVGAIYTFKKVQEEAFKESAAGQLEAAQDKANLFQSGLENVKSAAEAVKAAFNNYSDVQNKLKQCTKGTQEWRDALLEANNAALDLINEYPDLISSDAINWQDNQIVIDEKAIEDAKNQADFKVNVAETAAQLANQDVQIKQAMVDREQIIMDSLDKTWAAKGPWKNKLDSIWDDLAKTGTIDEAEQVLSSIGMNMSKNSNTLQYVDPAVQQFMKNLSAQNTRESMRNWSAKNENILKGQNTANSILAQNLLLDNNEIINSKYSGAISSAVGKQIPDLVDSLATTYTEDLKKKYKNGNESEIQQTDFKNYLENGLGLNYEDLEHFSATETGIKYKMEGDEKPTTLDYADIAYWEAVESNVGKINSLAEQSLSLFNNLESVSLSGDSFKEANALLDYFANGDFSHAKPQDFETLMNLAMSNPVEFWNTIQNITGKSLAEIELATGKSSEDIINDMTDFASGWADFTNSLNQEQIDTLNNLENASELSMQDFINAGQGLIKPVNLDLPDLSEPIEDYETLSDRVTEFKTSYDELSDSLYNGARLTDEQTNKLLDMGLSLDQLNKYTNDGFITNAEGLKEALLDTSESLRNSIEQARQLDLITYDNLAQDLLNLVSNTDQATIATDKFGKSLENILSQMDGLELSMAKYQQLQETLNGSTSFFEKFDKAKSADSVADWTDEWTGALKDMDELIQKGDYGGQAWKAGKELLLPSRLQDAEWPEIEKYINSQLVNRGLISKDKNGNYDVTQQNAFNFADLGLNTKLENGNTLFSGSIQEGLKLDSSIKSIKDLAAALDLSESSASALFSKLALVLNDGDSLWTQLAENAGDFGTQILVQEEEIATLGEKLQAAREKALETGDWNEYWEAKAAMDAAAKSLDNLRKKASTKVEVQLELRNQIEELEPEVERLRQEMIAANKAANENPTNNALQKAAQDATTAYKEAQQQLAELYGQVEEMSDFEIKIHLEEAYEKVETLKTKLQELQNGGKYESGSMVDQYGHRIETSKGAQDYLKNYQIPTLEQHITTTVEDTNSQKVFEQIKQRYAEAKGELAEPIKAEVDLTYDQVKFKLKIASLLVRSFNNVKASATLDVNTGGITAKLAAATTAIYAFQALKSSLGLFSGSAHILGSAYDSGSWGLKSSQTNALVGELGQELIVNPATGKYYTVGDNGAELINIPKGSIIFNHKQTEGLLKNRKINSRGTAYSEGNAFAGLPTGTPAPSVVIPGTSNNSGGNNNNNKGNKGGGKKGGGNGAAAAAGADLTYEQELLTIIRDETNAYHNLETAVKKLNQTYEFIARNNDRLWGRDVLVNMEKSIQALNEVYKKQRQIQDLRTKDYQASIARFSSTNELQYTKKVAHPSSTAEEPKWNTELVTFDNFNAVQFLQNLGYLKENPFTMDANGNYKDFDAVAFEQANAEYMRAYEQKYNAAIKAATTEAEQVAAENELANAKAIFELNKKFLGESDTALEDMIQSINNAQDSLEEMHDLAAEKITKRLEMKVALNDGELKIIDSRMKSMGDSIYKMAESMTMLWNGDPSSNNDKYSNIVEKALAYEQEYDEALAGLAIAQQNYLDPHAITSEKFIEIAEQARDGMLEQVDALLELKEVYAEYYGNVLSKATEELEKYTNQMDHQASVLEHLKNLMDLTGRKYDYKGQETIIRGQLEMAKDAYEVAKHWEMTTKENMEAAQKSYEELLLTDALGAENYKNEVLDKAVEYFNEAEEKMLASAEDYLQNYENLWQNTLDAVRDKWDKLATDGMGWDALLDSMDRAKSIQDEYLTTTNKLYETNTLLRKVNKDINSTDSMISKEKLNDFAKMVEARQKDNQLTQSGMEILKAKYELLQAELALEEMKDAKDTVRLQRDSEGNYGYVYTADQEKIEDAEQNFADKQNDLYNLVLGYSNDYREKYIQSLKEYEDKVMAIYENDALTEEERQRQLNELKQQYSDLWHAYDLTLQEAGLELNRVAAEGISEAWATQYDDRIAKQSEFLDASSEAEATLQDIMKEITEAHKDMTDDAELGLSDVEKKTKDVTTANHNLAEKLNTEVIPKVDTAIDYAEALTKQWESQATMVDKLIEKYHKLAEAMQAAMGEQAGMLGNTGGDISDKIWQHYQATGKFSDTLLKERSNAASKMTKEGGYYWNNSEMETFMEAYDNNSGGYSSWSDLAYDVIYNNHINDANYGKDSYGHDLTTQLEEMAKDTRRKKYNVEELASGGYTGEWGPEGKLAMLHEKELVLNATDTANMLDTIEALREMTRSMNLRSMISGMVDMIASPAFLNSQNNTLQQEVHITAEFPNATNHNEIEQAFTNLVNRASQYANRSNWKNSTDTLVESSVFD